VRLGELWGGGANPPQVRKRKRNVGAWGSEVDARTLQQLFESESPAKKDSHT
jgi:hypothetical protein